MILHQSNQPTGASPRHLNVRELHRELRRANQIIDTAATKMSVRQKRHLHTVLAINKVVEDEDILGTKPKPDYLKVMLIALCILLGWAWYTAQQDCDLFMQQIAQGEQ